VRTDDGGRESLLCVSTTPEPSPDAPEPRAGRTRRLVGRMIVLAVLITAVDQLTKYWAEKSLGDQAPVNVIGEFIQFRLLYNSGAAFSIGTGLTWLLTLIVVIVVIVVLRAATKIGSRGWAVAFGLLLGGAFGNLGDRLFRKPGFPEGHVVDFIDYGGFFVGNVADIAIVAAAIMIAVLTLRGVGVDGRRHHAHGAGHRDEHDHGASTDEA